MNENEPVRTALCGAADIKAWSGRPVPEQIRAQRALIDVVCTALGLAGLPDRIEQTGGDSALIVPPSGIDESVVVPDLLHGLRVGLKKENRLLVRSARLRLRFALTRGLVAPGPAGFGGDAVIECFRLLNSPPVKDALNEFPEADLAVIVSAVLYQDVIRQGFRGLRPEWFRKVQCVLPDKDGSWEGWLYVPGHS